MFIFIPSKKKNPAHLLLLWSFLIVLMVGCEPTPVPTPPEAGVSIAEIQGAGHTSPYENLTVENVHGIVTMTRGDGFFMQSVHSDGNPTTSEGIFVYQGLIPNVQPGDAVLVSAKVEEREPLGFGEGNLSITTLVFPYVVVLSSGNPLPAATIIGEGGRMPPTETIHGGYAGSVRESAAFEPEINGLDFYESLEGMLVQVNNAVAVAPTNQYREIVILPDRGTWAGVRTPNGGIVVRPGDFNPERIILDDGLRMMPFVQTGDYTEEPIIGVIDYAYGNYRLLPVESVPFIAGGITPDPPLAPATPGQLRIASYNAYNLSALDVEQMALLGDQIVNLMGSPDILGLQEIMDDDGVTGTLTVSADKTYRGIIDAIHFLGGPPYGYLNIDPLPDSDGGAQGSNIRVGFLYRLDTGLSLVDAPHGDAETAIEVFNEGGKLSVSLNPGRIEPDNEAFVNSRKPLVATFMYQGAPLILINNHFISKRGDSPLFGEFQPPIQYSEPKRMQQSQVVHEFITAILDIDPGCWVVVLGDLNDFHFSKPIQALQGEVLHNLIETLPVEGRYTYIYEGNSQVLDHILVSEGLYRRLVSFNILHVNSDFDHRYRFSDHDLLVADFGFSSVYD